MKTYQKTLLALITVALIAGCSGNKDAATPADAGKPEAAATATTTQDTQEITLLDGKASVRIPANMTLGMSQAGMSAYSHDFAAVNLVGMDAQGEDTTTLVAGTLENMKKQDPSMKLMNEGEIKVGDHTAKTFEAQLSMNGNNVHIAMAAVVIDGNAISVQVVGEQANAAKISAEAKAIFDSISVKG